MRREDVDALLFDLGGVVIRIDFDRVLQRWAELSGGDVDALRARFVLGEVHSHFETGRADAARFYASVREDLGLSLDDARVAEGWLEVLREEIPETVEAIRRVAPVIPCYLFSNTNPVHFAAWSTRHAAALRPMKRVFVSCELGLRKPQVEAFERVAREIGVAPGRILFFDDSLENVEGARRAGMQAVHVTRDGTVAEALAPWLRGR